jgi:hypothetical protein
MKTQSSNSSGSAKSTTNHDEIRHWVEARGGHPALVKRTARDGHGGILRIDFPGFSGERSLKEISWDDFFETFEDSRIRSRRAPAGRVASTSWWRARARNLDIDVEREVPSSERRVVVRQVAQTPGNPRRRGAQWVRRKASSAR